MGSYVPHSLKERQEMLERIGVSDVEALYAGIPDAVRLKRPLDLPAGKSELEVGRFFQGLAEKNKVYGTVFRGAGAYRHYIPAVVKAVASKERFLTAYTPYQPEISQGVLQGIFEFQTVVCELTGMDVANASVYDGATAAAEAVTMCADAKRQRALVSSCANPGVIRTVQTYCESAGRDCVLIPARNGATDLDALEELAGDAACVYVEAPNFFGVIEDYEAMEKIVHGKGARFIMGCNPIALCVLKSPGEYGADVAVGEGQPLGIPLSFGGPYLGFIACREDMVRSMAGRIVGETTDEEGKRAFVLTLQTREQHIRREKASSNICTNAALCALTATAYAGAMGSVGLRRVAEQCYGLAHCAAEQISSIPGFGLKYPEQDFFHEFVTACPGDPEKLNGILSAHDILGGLPLGGDLLWCCTELNGKEEIDRLCRILREEGRG